MYIRRKQPCSELTALEHELISSIILRLTKTGFGSKGEQNKIFFKIIFSTKYLQQQMLHVIEKI